MDSSDKSNLLEAINAAMEVALQRAIKASTDRQEAKERVKVAEDQRRRLEMVKTLLESSRTDLSVQVMTAATGYEPMEMFSEQELAVVEAAVQVALESVATGWATALGVCCE